MKPYILLGLALFIANLSFAQSDRSRAEVFIQIEDRGNFTVQLDDDLVGSNKGKFRFYEVYSVTPTLSILQGNQKVYSKKLTVRADQRLILNFSVRSGLKILKTLSVYRNGQYALDDFDNYIGGYNTGVPPRQTVDDRMTNYDNLLSMVKREAFDDGKIKLLQAYATNGRLTTQQTANLLQSFLRDEGRLTAIKSMAHVILDPQQMYTLKDSFTFISGKEDFLAFLNSIPVQRSRYMMDVKSFEQLKNDIKREAFDDEKTKLIQVATQQTAISTAQVAELIKLYSFDDKAFNFAKVIYPAVSDPQRYFSLKDAFKFIGNQQAFLDFLGRQ